MKPLVSHFGGESGASRESSRGSQGGPVTLLGGFKNGRFEKALNSDRKCCIRIICGFLCHLMLLILKSKNFTQLTVACQKTIGVCICDPLYINLLAC